MLFLTETITTGIAQVLLFREKQTTKQCLMRARHFSPHGVTLILTNGINTRNMHHAPSLVHEPLSRSCTPEPCPQAVSHHTNPICDAQTRRILHSSKTSFGTLQFPSTQSTATTTMVETARTFLVHIAVKHQVPASHTLSTSSRTPLGTPVVRNPSQTL